MSSINSQVMRSNNLMLIIRTIQQNAPISRTELTSRVGLTSASVVNITNALIDAGMLVQKGYASSTTHGRRAVMLDVNAEALYTIGLEMNTERIVVGISDFRGRIIYSADRAISTNVGVTPIVDKIVALVQESIEKLQIPQSKILGLGLALPGPLDSRWGVMVNPPNFPGWINVPICELLQKRLNMPVCCDRETNTAVLAEHFYGAAMNYRTVFYMSLFKLGIGGGLLSAGNVMHGFCDGAGEIGHTTIDPNGPVCVCGNRGCLETIVSEQAILKAARALYADQGAESPVNRLEDVIQLAQSGDPVCMTALDRAATSISVALGNVINLFSPENIVLGGPLPDMSPLLVEMIQEKIRTKKYPSHCANVKVVHSAFGEKTFVVGGVVLAMDNFLQDRVSRCI